MVNGFTDYAITKLDVLSGLDEIKVCTAYRYPDGKVSERFPSEGHTLARVEPIYETLPGWQEDIVGINRFEDLPQTAQEYLQFIANRSGVDISMTSTGPKRSQTMYAESDRVAVA